MNERPGKVDGKAGLTDQSDQTLMEQVRAGDLRKLAVLFERHHKPLFHFFLRQNADRGGSEDLTQEVFFRILRYRHTYDPAHTFSSWMYQIARNVKRDHDYKRRGEAPPVVDTASDAPGIDAEINKSQEAQLIRRALEQLPEDKREVLILSRYQNLKYDEIARILGVEVNTVKVRVYRAVRALGEIYSELAGEKLA